MSTQHWQSVYASRESSDVSWYQQTPSRSLELLAASGLGPDSTIIDVGGGDSTLVDALLEHGVAGITVLDLSATALARARARLGSLAQEVTWLEADITRAELPHRAFSHWHDRAVFHFLTDPDHRAQYASTAARALRPGATMIVATFALDGPTRCSGLDVARYSSELLAAEFGAEFAMVRALGDVHRTPAGMEQRFTYVVFERR